jgi:Membrane proteins related to metalloendopeptidases
LADGKMASPVAGTVSCEWHGYNNHAGMDIACNVGTPVYAAYAGTVEKAGTNIVPGRTGYGVLIRNPDREAQYYGHLSRILVKVGQKVALGEKIALSGATGNVTGPHLHFETWKAGATGGVGGDTNPRIHFNSHGVVPGSTTGQKASSSTSTSFLPLAVDGNEAHKTITEEERALKKAGFYTGVIEADYGKTAVRGTVLKEGEQRWLKARGQYTRAIDGDFGVESVKAEQRQLAKLGHYSQSIDGNTRVSDGDRGAWTIKGLQAALNTGAIK